MLFVVSGVIDLGELWDRPGWVERSRFERVEAVLSAFWGEAESSAGFDGRELLEAEDRLGVRIPAALREGLARFGRSPGMNCQDRFFGSEKLSSGDGFLRFRIENQGCAVWGVRLEESSDDPALYVSFDGGLVWRQSFGVVSAFFENVALGEAIFAPVWADNARLDADPEPVLRELGLRRLPTERFELANPGRQKIRFFASGGLLVADHAQTWLWVVALSSATLDDFGNSLPLDWELRRR